MHILILPIIILIILIAGGVWAKREEDKKWNKGVCPKCNRGFYKSFDMDSSGAVGFSCTECDYTTWQSYNTR
jgi:protein-arginine kinase activator protein McsA